MTETIKNSELKQWKNVIELPMKYGYLLGEMSRDYVNYNNATGWNYDAYFIDYDSIIVEGYRTHNITAKASRELCEKYDAQACKIYERMNSERHLQYEKMKGETTETRYDYLDGWTFRLRGELFKNLEAFIEEVLEQKEGK